MFCHQLSDEVAISAGYLSKSHAHDMGCKLVVYAMNAGPDHLSGRIQGGVWRVSLYNHLKDFLDPQLFVATNKDTSGTDIERFSDYPPIIGSYQDRAFDLDSTLSSSFDAQYHTYPHPQV